MSCGSRANWPKRSRCSRRRCRSSNVCGAPIIPALRPSATILRCCTTRWAAERWPSPFSSVHVLISRPAWGSPIRRPSTSAATSIESLAGRRGRSKRRRRLLPDFRLACSQRVPSTFPARRVRRRKDGYVIVGRDPELAQAREFLKGVAQGAQALLIEGQAGIGKTALWLAVLAAAAAKGYRVLRCGGDQAEARLSFVGLGDLVGGVADEGLGYLPRPQREALELALARRSAGAGRLPDAKTIGMGLRSLMVELAKDRPVLLAVDDVQWLDGATARALAFVARRLDVHTVGFLGTSRMALPAADPFALERALGPERFARLRLGRLDLGAVPVPLEARLGQPYPRPVLRRIAEVSDGNPLFALEIAH